MSKTNTQQTLVGTLTINECVYNISLSILLLSNKFIKILEYLKLSLIINLEFTQLIINYYINGIVTEKVITNNEFGIISLAKNDGT